MHRTQIYFEETMFKELKLQANSLGLSLSAYIRKILSDNLKQKKQKPKDLDFSEFTGIWEDNDITLETIRKKAWK